MTAATLLAHQGGWDEALFVVGPLAVIILMLRAAKKRAAHLGLDLDQPAAEPPPDPEP